MGTRLRFLLAGLVLAGCAETPKPPPPALPPTPPPVVDLQSTLAAPPVAGPQWTLESIGGVAVKTERQPTLYIDNGVASGSSGCNNYSAQANLSGSNLSFGVVGMTKMACSEPAMAIETNFAAMLSKAKVVTTAGGVLVMYDAIGTPLARFTTKRAG